jgi:hypothetical protein
VRSDLNLALQIVAVGACVLMRLDDPGLATSRPTAPPRPVAYPYWPSPAPAGLG